VIALLAGFVPINFPAEMTSGAPWPRSWCCGFAAWVAVAPIWYFSYGIKHSQLGRHEPAGLLETSATAEQTKD